MIKYTKSVVLRIDGPTGNADEKAQVEVFFTGTTTLASIFEDSDGLIPITQPFFTNTLAEKNPGQFNFYVAVGRYDIIVNGNESEENQTKLIDQSIGLEEKSTLGLMRINNKIVAALTASVHIKAVPFGDSMALEKYSIYQNPLERMMNGCDQKGEQRTDPTISGGFGGGDLALNVPVNINVLAGQWPDSVNGAIIEYNASSTSSFIQAGVNPKFTDLEVYYLIEPGAGSFDVIVNSVNVGTVATAGTKDLGIFKYAQAENTFSVEINSSGGNVKLMFVHSSNSTRTGIDFYSQFFKGGANLADMNLSGFWPKFLADADPDLITFEMKDTQSTYKDDLDTWALAIKNNSPASDVIIIGTTPIQTEDPVLTTQAQNALTRAMADRNTFIFYDGFTPVISFARMLLLNWQGDGTHPSFECQAYLANLMINGLIIPNTLSGRTGTAVNDRSTPSRLASGTSIGLAEGFTYSIDAVDGNEFDWINDFGRSIVWKDFQGKAYMGFSQNQGVQITFIPDVANYGISEDVGYNITTVNGQAEIRFNNNEGGQPDKLALTCGILTPGVFTIATLPAANSWTNGFIMVTDASGGAVPCYSRGATTVDWRRFSDNAVVS